MFTRWIQRPDWINFRRVYSLLPLKLDLLVADKEIAVSLHLGGCQGFSNLLVINTAWQFSCHLNSGDNEEERERAGCCGSCSPEVVEPDNTEGPCRQGLIQNFRPELRGKGVNLLDSASGSWTSVFPDQDILDSPLIGHTNLSSCPFLS